MMGGRHMQGAVALLVRVLAVAGCTPAPTEKPAPPTPAGWPSELADFTIVWTAEPGIDVTTDGAAIAARAYAESYYLASITEDAKYLYPGFADSVEPNQPSPGGPPGTSELHPRLGLSDPAVLDRHRSASRAEHHPLSWRRHRRRLRVPVRRGPKNSQPRRIRCERRFQL